MSLEPHEYASLAAWVRKAHRQQKHCIVFVDGYDPAVVCSELNAVLDGESISAVDLQLGDWWVSVRKMLPSMPVSLLRTQTVSVCTITK